MSFFEQHIELDGVAVTVIAAGMRAVAKADGDVHPRELQMIEAFESDVVTGGVPDPKLVLGTSDLQEAYVRSLVMVALADGNISAPERAVILELSAGLGVYEAQVDRITNEVKRWFLDAFSGVVIFRESVQQVADDLGIDLP